MQAASASECRGNAAWSCCACALKTCRPSRIDFFGKALSGARPFPGCAHAGTWLTSLLGPILRSSKQCIRLILSVTETQCSSSH